MIINHSKHAKTMNRDQLHTVGVPTALPSWQSNGRPDGAFWKGISHGEIADLTIATLEGMGIEVVEEQYVVCLPDQAGLIGDITIRPTDDMDLTSLGVGKESQFGFEQEGMDMHLLFRHSNDARWRLTFLGGARVLICSNGMVAGRFGGLKIKRKHSKNLTLPNFVEASVQAVMGQFQTITTRKRQLECISLTEAEGDHIIADMGHNGVLPWRYIGNVVKEWKEPTHEEFRVLKNGWGLMQACTEVIKSRPVVEQVDDMENCRDYIHGYGLKTNQIEPDAEAAPTPPEEAPEATPEEEPPADQLEQLGPRSFGGMLANMGRSNNPFNN
jgi:hypothetical protein